MAKFNLTASTTVASLRKEFNEAFGSVLKVYNKNKVSDDNATLAEIGLKEDGVLECRSSLLVGSFISRMSEKGLKVKVYTQDEWVSVLPGLTLESSGKVKKNATLNDQKDMIAYQRDNNVEIEEDAPKAVKEEDAEEQHEGPMSLIEKLKDTFIVESDYETYYNAEWEDEDTQELFIHNIKALMADSEIEIFENMQFTDADSFTQYLDEDPDDLLLPQSIVAAAYCTYCRMDIEEGEYVYLDSQLYYFNDGMDFHYEYETDIDVN